jgi:hypothetical protein
MLNITLKRNIYLPNQSFIVTNFEDLSPAKPSLYKTIIITNHHKSLLVVIEDDLMSAQSKMNHK